MQKEMQLGRRTRRLGFVLMALAMGSVLLSGPALADIKTWTANNGIWSYAGNWTPVGVPLAGDDVFLTQSGTTSKSVTYRNTASPTPLLNSLTIDATSTGNMTLNQGSYADPLASVNEYIGYDGKGVHLQSIGTNTISSGLYLGYNSVGSSGNYALSGGSLTAANQYVGHNGVGTINHSLGTNTISNSLYLGYNSGSNGTYTLSGSGQLMGMNAYIGTTFGATGAFTQSGGTSSIQNLSIGGGFGTNGTYNLQGGLLQGQTISLNTGGAFNQTSGILYSNTFNQNGGTVTGTLDLEGAFNYNSGTFNGRLVNGGTSSFNADFTAANGMENEGTVNFMPGTTPGTTWRMLTFNGEGLLNKSVFNLTSGALAGSGPLVNDGWMNLNHVTFWGQTAFTNNAILQVTNNADFESGNGSTFVNNGEIRLVFTQPTGTMPPQYAPLADLGLAGDGGLQNNGVINLNGNVIHDGTLTNNASGIINGNGYILSDLVNAGVINMGGGLLNISKDFNNTGVINLNGTLFGGTITNSGTIEGQGTVSSNIVNHGSLETGASKVTMTGALTNASDGQILVRSESKLLINQGLAVNDGLISVSDGNFDNNNHTLTNNGNIATKNTLFSTGGLINNSGGQVYFSGGATDGNRITGDVTNNSGGKIVVQYAPAIFLGNIVNSGEFKVTDTHFTCLGTFTGSFISDPATNTFTDLIERPEDYLVGGMVDGEWDRFLITNNFINQSQQSTLWDTVAAELAFISGDDTQHQFYLPGVDLGGSRQGFESNFAWGRLDITGQEVSLLDGNEATQGAAQYVGLLLGAILNGNRVTNIFGADGLDIYYDPLLADNAYLQGLTYELMGGGFLAPVTQTPLSEPVPIPPTVWMVLSGLAGLGLLRKKRGNQS